MTKPLKKAVRAITPIMVKGGMPPSTLLFETTTKRDGKTGKQTLNAASFRSTPEIPLNATPEEKAQILDNVIRDMVYKGRMTFSPDTTHAFVTDQEFLDEVTQLLQQEEGLPVYLQGNFRALFQGVPPGSNHQELRDQNGNPIPPRHSVRYAKAAIRLLNEKGWEQYLHPIPEDVIEEMKRRKKLQKELRDQRKKARQAAQQATPRPAPQSTPDPTEPEGIR